jgi:hypothetical protein
MIFVKVGLVYKIAYFSILPNNKRRFFKFTGLCIKFNKKTLTAIFSNKILEDRFFFTVDLSSPSIIEVLNLKEFEYPSRLLKILKFPNNLFIIKDLSAGFRLEGEGCLNFSIFKFLLNKNNKKIRKKFRLKK